METHLIHIFIRLHIDRQATVVRRPVIGNFEANAWAAAEGDSGEGLVVGEKEGEDLLASVVGCSVELGTVRREVGEAFRLGGEGLGGEQW